MEANRDLWDELTPIHARSAFYDLVCSRQAFPSMERGGDGWRRLPAGHPEILLTFSLKAHKSE